jgi:hypothetical protein
MTADEVREANGLLDRLRDADSFTSAVRSRTGKLVWKYVVEGYETTVTLPLSADEHAILYEALQKIRASYLAKINAFGVLVENKTK